MTTTPVRPLNSRDVRTLSLSALGGALEFYDFVVFVFFTAVLSALFFPPEMPDWLRQAQTFGIFAAGYLARPLGGIIIAHFGDLLGRKRMFTLSLLLMSLPTLAMGLLPTYAQIGIAAPLLLLLLRILQGAAIGGEVPGAWVFVAEHVPANRTGIAVGSLTAGLTGGILLGSLTAAATHSYFSAEQVHDFGWRLPFILGGLFGLVSVYLRRYLDETPVFREMQAERQLATELPVKTILRHHPGRVLLSMLFTWVLSAAIVVVILFTPTYLQKQFTISHAEALAASSISTLCLTTGCLLFGWLSDRIGVRLTLAIGCCGLLASSWWFYHGLPAAGWQQGYMLTAFFVGVVGSIPYVLVRAFPPALRFSGLSFSYNVAYAIFGGLTPVVLSLWLPSNALAPAHYVAALALLGMVLALIPRLLPASRLAPASC